MDYSDILEKALAEGKRRHPSAPIQHHAAFANAVAYLVTGASGGYGGPSVREHAVSHAAFSQAVMPGEWEYAAATNFADPIVFGAITDLHFRCYRTEACFDDASCDIKILKK